MQFRVPQFLDIEDKIFGPFTFSQFVYLAGGAGLCYILYKVLGVLFGFIPIILIAGLSIALAFYRPNNKSFLYMIQSALGYYSQDKLYIWKRKTKKESIHEKEKTQEIETNYQPKLNSSKLRDLAWSLDVLDSKKDNNTGS